MTRGSSSVSVNLSGAAPYDLAPGFWGVNVRPYTTVGASQAALIDATPVRYVIWPGGAIADRYNMSSGTLYSLSGQASTMPSNEAQFVAWCRSSGCSAIIQVPAETDRPWVAAAEINYTVKTLGFQPTLIEIGNEPALWDHFDVPWSKWASAQKDTVTATQYAQLVHAYIAAIRSVDPSARFVGLPGLGTGSSGETTWLADSVSVNGPNLSAVAIHVYPAGSDSPILPTLSAFYSTLSTGASSLDVRVPKDRAAMAAACSTCGSIPILVTELGASGVSTSSFTSYMEGFPNVPYIATELVQGIALNLSGMYDFAFQSTYPGSWVAANGSIDPVYTLYSTLLANLGTLAQPLALSATAAGLAVALLQNTTTGAERLLAVNTNVATSYSLQIGALPWATGSEATATWWNGTAPAPVSLSERAVPSVWTVAPESVALLASGGNLTIVPPPHPGTIAGEVTARSGAPLGGAEVVAVGSEGSGSATSNSYGGYSISVAAGSYSVRVSATGFVAATGTATVRPGTTTSLNFTLKVAAASYPAAGVVVAAEGGPLSHATVQARNGSTSVSTVSDANGSFSLALPNGTYTITATDSGYDPASVTVTVAGGPVRSVDLSLTSAAGSGSGTSPAGNPSGSGGWIPLAGIAAIGIAVVAGAMLLLRRRRAPPA
ncbi:MAG: carboxypeptidase regulatory-like domain-containing protein [Thermoplasmata archaeon]